MTESEVNALHVQLARFEATISAKLDALSSDNARGETLHLDHEARLRRLEANQSEGDGVWKVVTAGGVVGGALMAVLALGLRAFGI